MYLDAPFIPVWEIAWLWKCVCRTWDMAHEVNGVDLKLITGAKEKRLIADYLGKYIAKVDERTEKHDGEHTGRWWGRWNIAEIGKMEFEVTDWEAERIVTFVLRLRSGNGLWEPVDPTLCTIFGDSLGSSEFSERIVQLVGYVRQGR
jgi:hypothetical protein